MPKVLFIGFFSGPHLRKKNTEIYLLLILFLERKHNKSRLPINQIIADILINYFTSIYMF